VSGGEGSAEPAELEEGPWEEGGELACTEALDSGAGAIAWLPTSCTTASIILWEMPFKLRHSPPQANFTFHLRIANPSHTYTPPPHHLPLNLYQFLRPPPPPPTHPP